MKKYFFYAFVMALTSACLFSCSNDDSNTDDSSSSTLPTPKYESLVAQILLDEPVKVRPPQAEGIQLDLTAITITEDGLVFFDIKEVKIDPTTNEPAPKNDDKDIVVVQKAKSFDGKKLLLDNNGIVEILPKTKTVVSVRVNIDVRIDVPGYGEVDFQTSQDEPSEATVNQPSTPSTKEQMDLFRTWKIRGMMVDLEGDVTLSKEFTGGNLKPLCDEAIRQGATLTAEEQAEFNKTIQSITITRAGAFAITYTDNTVCYSTYQWQGLYTFQLSLLTLDMANKYITEGTLVSYEIKNNRCNLKFATEVKGSKNYIAVLILQLEY